LGRSKLRLKNHDGVKYADNFDVLWYYHQDVFRARRTSSTSFPCILWEIEGRYDVHKGAFIDDNLPIRQKKLIEAWAELHNEELKADWNLVMNGEEPFRIAPLV
jgi:hypothetical protein